MCRMMLQDLRWLLAPVIACVVASCGGRTEVAQRPLVIGMDATYPPFEFVDERGRMAGVSVELGRAIGQALGRDVEFRNINFDGLITALKTGSIDLVISSMTANDDRRKSIDFSDPYVKTGLSLLIAKTSAVQTLEDLKQPGRRVVVRLGTTGEAWARRNLPQATLVSLDTDAACVMETVKGGVDAWVYDQISIMNYHARHRDTTRAILAPLREEVWAIGLRQNEPELKKSVNDALATFRAAGGFTKLADQLLSSERKMMAEQGLPFVFELGGQE